MIKTSLFAATTALALAAGTAHAATFTSEMAFSSSVTGSIETFDDDLFNTRPSAVRDDFTVTETGVDPGITTLFQPLTQGNGTPSLQFFLQSAATLRFDSFADPMLNAFGLTIFSSGSGEVEVTVNDTDMSTFTLGNGGTTFFGITTDSAISSIAFGGATIEGVFTGVDDVFTGTVAPVPLPASGLFLLTGLGLLVAGRRRRRAA